MKARSSTDRTDRWRITYADCTASGRSLGSSDNAVRDRVLPRYAKAHTESSGTGVAAGRLREDARQVINDAVCGADEHVVISCGSAATATIQPGSRLAAPR